MHIPVIRNTDQSPCEHAIFLLHSRTADSVPLHKQLHDVRTALLLGCKVEGVCQKRCCRNNLAAHVGQLLCLLAESLLTVLRSWPLAQALCGLLSGRSCGRGRPQTVAQAAR